MPVRSNASLRPPHPASSSLRRPSIEKFLGALPVVAEFCRRLDLAGIVDRACPVRDLALLSHGQVIEALVANRLTSPTPLLHVADWARRWAVQEVWGIDPAALNDDRIGRALDAIAGQLDALVGAVGARAITTFGVEVAACTGISPRSWCPAPTTRPTRRWWCPATAIQGPPGRPQAGPDGPCGHRCWGVPLFHRADDRGAGETAQVIGAMTWLRRLAGQRRFLPVGDSKPVGYANLTAIADATSAASPRRPRPRWPATCSPPRLGPGQPGRLVAARTGASPPSGAAATGSPRTP